MAGFSIYTDRKFQSDNLANNLNHTLDSLNEELKICHGTSTSTETLRNKFEGLSHLNDSLGKKIGILYGAIDEKNFTLNTNVMLVIANSLEEISNRTSGRDRSDLNSNSDFRNKVFKNAIFQNILTFGADTMVLRKALEVMKRREIVGSININRLVLEAPNLFLLKRAWLSKAILTLENAVHEISKNPSIQHSAFAEVELPQSIWVHDVPYIINLDENQLFLLKSKKNF